MLSRIARSAACTALLLLAAALPASAEKLPPTPVPDWVVPRELPPPDGPQGRFLDDGIETLLIDHQTRIDTAHHEDYSRRVFQVSTRAGLDEAGLVSLTLDPASERLQLHWVRIARDGQVIDLTDRLDFTRMRRELELGDGVITGTETLSAPIDDLRVGDVLDVALSRRVTPPIFAQDFQTTLFERSPIPVHALYDRFLLPATRALDVTPSELRPDRTETRDGLTSHDFALIDAPAAKIDWDTPLWRNPLGEIVVSSFRSWEQISATLAPKFRPDPVLGPEMSDWVAQIRATAATPEDRITAALRLVQDRIRYHGDEIGAGGFVPRPPALVARRGWGDCKDKALLLVSLLAALDVEADVALANSWRGRSLDTALPGPWLFDHAIVRVHDAAGEFWLDPTGEMQGGRGRQIAVSDFGFALPLVPGGSGLVPVQPPAPEAPTEEVHDLYRFIDSGARAAELEVTTIFRGARADEERAELGSESLDERARSYLDFYQRRFPGVEALRPLAVTDDLEANVLTLTEAYAIPRKAFDEKEYWHRFWLNPYTVKGELPEPEADRAPGPVVLEAGRRLVHQVRLENLPQALKAPRPLDIDSRFFHYARSGEAGPNWVEAVFSLDITSPEVPEAELADYRSLLARVEENRDWYYDLYYRGKGVDLANRPLLGSWTPRELMLALFGALLLGVSVVALRNSARKEMS